MKFQNQFIVLLSQLFIVTIKKHRHSLKFLLIIFE